MADIVAKTGISKWVWIVGGIILLIIVFVGLTSASGSDGGNGGGTPGPGNPPYTPPGPPVVPPTDPKQVLKTYTCETRKVCQGRGGYANWVKTGTQKKCNASNVSQALCIADCLGTCYAWVTE